MGLPGPSLLFSVTLVVDKLVLGCLQRLSRCHQLLLVMQMHSCRYVLLLIEREVTGVHARRILGFMSNLKNVAVIFETDGHLLQHWVLLGI